MEVCVISCMCVCVCKPCLFGCASGCKHGAGVCGSCAVAPRPSHVHAFDSHWSIKRGIGGYDLRENQPQSGGRSPGVNVCDICSQISAYHWVCLTEAGPWSNNVVWMARSKACELTISWFPADQPYTGSPRRSLMCEYTVTNFLASIFSFICMYLQEPGGCVETGYWRSMLLNNHMLACLLVSHCLFVVEVHKLSW